jgi:hypothetical protein
MKLLLSLMVIGTVLFAGGDIRPMQIHKPQVVQKTQRGCHKPNIQKCPDCEDVAELCPYNGEDIPLAETEPCQADLNR